MRQPDVDFSASATVATSDSGAAENTLRVDRILIACARTAPAALDSCVTRWRVGLNGLHAVTQSPKIIERLNFQRLRRLGILTTNFLPLFFFILREMDEVVF